MYNPASFADNDPAAVAALVKRYPLGTLITAGPAGLKASLLPFRLQTGDRQTLVAHLARANDHWQALATVDECLVVFRGADAYVSPGWYVSKQETGRVVPTWNYETVQIRGIPRLVHDAAGIRALVAGLTDQMEKPRDEPWRLEDAPDDFIATQLRAVVGLTIDVTAIEGKWKMSQNRDERDIRAVAAGLSAPGDPHSNLTVAATVVARNGLDG